MDVTASFPEDTASFTQELLRRAVLPAATGGREVADAEQLTRSPLGSGSPTR